MEMLQEIFGENWETITGMSAGTMALMGTFIWRYIKNKSIGEAVTKVSGFFTKDMSDQEKTDATVILRNLASKSSLNVLNNLVTQLEQFDVEEIKGYVNDAMLISTAILSVMVKNGAFDENEALKITLESIIAAYLND